MKNIFILSFLCFINLLAFTESKDTGTENSCPDWAWKTGKMYSWSWNGISREQPLTQEQADRVAKEYYDDGVAIVNYGGMLFRFNFLDRTDNLILNAQKVVRACHKYGIKVLEHLDLTIPSYCGYPDMEKHLDWLQYDIITGRRYFWFCFNNPDFQKFMLDYLEKYVKATNVDAIMIDELNYAGQHTCGCRYCRDKFHRDTGYSIPYDAQNQFWNDETDPAHLAFIRWRMKSVVDFKKKIYARLRRINPQMVFMTYSADFLNPFSYLRGGCLWEHAGSCNFIGYEVWERVAPFESYISILGSMKTRQAIGDYYHNPTWIIPYGRTKSQREFAAILAYMSRCFIWGQTPFLDWGFEIDKRKLETMADVALLASIQTRNSSSSPLSQYYPVYGWMTVLLQNNIQFDVILDPGLNPETLKKYKILILASAQCLSSEQINAVRNFAEGGGTVIFTYNTGMRDENARPLNTNSLIETMGVKPLKIASMEMNVKVLTPKSEALSGPVKFTRIMRISDFKNCPGRKITAWAENSSGKYPLLITLPYGKGKLIYSPAMLGGNTYCTRIIRGKKYSHMPDGKISELMKHLVLSQENSPVKLAECPGKL
ncbi:MAG: beta-galactosidase trimerization domain-containing protein, partial [Victivallaceae bacterium]|nr:beta-galactosidase trimerization domain-containing protein [Victivallaceae bacterium]